MRKHLTFMINMLMLFFPVTNMANSDNYIHNESS